MVDELLKLDNGFIHRQDGWELAIIGCGGTGSLTAEMLCRVLPANVRLILVDMDIVEPQNLIRQNFYPDELGQMKSEVLAKRLSKKYNRAVGYSLEPIGLFSVHYQEPMLSFGQQYAKLIDIPIIVGCVDNGPARFDIMQMVKKTSSQQVNRTWYIDSGNGENFGQVLIGNNDGPGFVDTMRSEKDHPGICFNVPYPTLQRPDILQQQPYFRNCEEAPEQGPTINQGMAYLVVEMVRRLITGTCSWIQLYLDMEKGTLTPVYATRENVAKMFEQVKELEKDK